MVQAIPRSKARLTERQQFWLDHLRVCREQGHTLRGYAKSPWTVGQWVVHRALDAQEPRGPDRAGPSAPTFVPVRITPGAAAFSCASAQRRRRRGARTR